MNCSFNYTGDDRVYGKWYKRQPEGEKHYLDKSSTACVLLHPALLDNVSECVVTTHIPNISFNHSGVYNCEVKIPSSIQSIDSEGEGTRLEVYGKVQNHFYIQLFFFIKKETKKRLPALNCATV